MLNNKKLIGLLISGIAVISLVFFSLNNRTTNVVSSAVNETGAWVGRVFCSREYRSEFC